MQKYIKIDEIAHTLDISRATIYRYIKKGELSAIKIGNSYRVSQKELKKFLNRKKV